MESTIFVVAIYMQELFSILAGTIDALCTPGLTVLYLCRLRRGTAPAKHQGFYQGLRERGFQVDTILVGSDESTAAAGEGSRPGTVDPQLSRAFRKITDQRLPFELVRGTKR